VGAVLNGTAYWQHVVLSKVALARTELDQARCAEPPGTDWIERAGKLLEEADSAARRPGSKLRLWLSGSAINRAFVNLHAAQVLMAKHAGDDERVTVMLSWAMSRVKTTMPASAERRADLEARYLQATNPHVAEGAAMRRSVLEKALEWSYGTTDAQYARLRSFRNILSGVSLAVLVFAVALAVLGLIWPDTLQLCFTGSTGRVCPTG
jgi:hypothetical protein